MVYIYFVFSLLFVLHTPANELAPDKSGCRTNDFHLAPNETSSKH
jgi:hypothetical protein